MQYRSLLSLIVIETAVCGFIVFWALVGTNPGSLGPVGVTVWFLALWGMMAGVLGFLFYVAKSHVFNDTLPSERLAGSFRQGLLIAGAGSVLLALSSLRQLSLRDAILVLILTVLIEFYFRTRR